MVRSLKTTVGLILRSPVPIVTLWGGLGIMIYDDACSSSPVHAIPGCSAYRSKPEVADFNDNVMKVGLAGGTILQNEN